MASLTDKERIEAAAARAEDASRLKKAIAELDLLNDDDPKRVVDAGRDVGYELHFSRLLTEKVLLLDPDASEALLIASRAQHLCRWKIPREDYPMDREGYLKWRSDLKKFHATKACEVLEEYGYASEVVEEVREIVLKKSLRKNADSQTMEDALCLVFLESQFADFRHKTSEEKMISILQKTWKKMSEAGKAAALKLDLGEEEAALVQRALA